MRIPAIALSVLLASGAALAQQTTSPPPGAGTSPATPPAVSPVPPAASSGTSATNGSMSALQPGQMRADDIVGTRVYGPNDANVGSVDDIIVNTTSKQVEAAILSVGGFLGIGNKLVAVPIDQLQMGQDGRLSISLTREQLEQAPEFAYGSGRTGSGSGATGTGTGGGGTMGTGGGMGTTTAPGSTGGTTRTP